MEPIQTSERQSLKKIVIEEIKQYIQTQGLAAGDRLPTERKFTELFGVSRSVIRESLSYLENTGIVRIRQGQGAFINESNIGNLLNSFFFLWQINHGDIHDVLGLRVLFECSAIEEIVKNDNQKVIEKLAELANEKPSGDTLSTFREIDIAFHQQLLRATNNLLFTQMTEMITSYFYQIQHIRLTKAECEQIQIEHIQIVDALNEKNSVNAKYLLTEHIKETRV